MRRCRYELQQAATQLIYAHRPEHPAGRRWRVVSCLRGATGEVVVYYQPAIGRASYGGACVCGQAWVCAVCSARITELRRAEVAAAHAVHAAAGGSALMATLTVPHALDDRLSALLGTRRGGSRSGLRGAVQRLRNSRPYRWVAESLGVVGSIVAVEITRGSAGWHPHQHWLLLVAADEDDRLRIAARDALAREWQRCARAAGLGEPSLDRGVDLGWAWDASRYLAKLGHERSSWGADAEIARSAVKRGRRGSRGPFELLRDAAAGDPSAISAWIELIQSTYRVPQLQWSRGLRAALAIADRSDEELARTTDEDSVEVATIDRRTWRRVLELGYRARCELLEAAERDPAYGVSDFLASLDEAPHAVGYGDHQE